MKAGSILVLIVALVSATAEPAQGQSFDILSDRLGEAAVEDPSAASLLELDHGYARSWRSASAAGSSLRWVNGSSSTARLQANPPPHVLGAFLGLIVGAGIATYQMSNTEGDPDAKVLLYLPVGALAGYLAVRLFGESRDS